MDSLNNSNNRQVQQPQQQQQQQQGSSSMARRWAQSVAQSAAHTLNDFTARKYTLPDKNVASQLLMYRQLLHTKCRPGLKLSREYQGTPAQVAVKHMPWWAEGCEQTKKMVISYDNLIRRLWLHGAIYPHQQNAQSSPDLLGDNTSNNNTSSSDIETLLDEDGMPPIPHEYWVSRLGFQQTDPVTDFRSGGVLSLAMMLHVTESCPGLFQRFVRPDGDACVLPFGITSINITDMMSKFLMLSKTVDRMDALLSQKPFWRMFADPNALTACQELSLDMLADVVVELTAERAIEGETVTVFDFTAILERTEKRVQYDLLGAGPKSVEELYQIHARLKQKYKAQLQQLTAMAAAADNADTTTSNAETSTAAVDESATSNNSNMASGEEANINAAAARLAAGARDQVWNRASGLAAGTTSLVGNVFQKIKSPGFSSLSQQQQEQKEETVVFGGTPTTTTAAAGVDNTGTAEKEEASNNNQETTMPMNAAAASNSAAAVTTITTTSNHNSEEDWAGTDIQPATDAVKNFTIGGDDDDDDDVL